MRSAKRLMPQFRGVPQTGGREMATVISFVAPDGIDIRSGKNAGRRIDDFPLRRPDGLVSIIAADCALGDVDRRIGPSRPDGADHRHEMTYPIFGARLARGGFGFALLPEDVRDLDPPFP